MLLYRLVNEKSIFFSKKYLNKNSLYNLINKGFEEKNIKKDTLSDEMMMFIVLNTASLQLIPTNVIAIRTALN